MPISTHDQYIGAAKDQFSILRTTARVTVAGTWFGTLDLAGNPGAGVLAGTNTANGVVPTSATAGCPVINAFGGGATGYLTRVEFGSTVASRARLSDLLFKAGAYAFNANVTLATQPSYAARMPGGSYKGTQIVFEAVTAFTGNPTVTVTYTNQDGTTGRTTGAVALGVAPTVGRKFILPLQAGDSGVQRIDSVVCTVATAGTFNILVQRPLWGGRVKIANDGANNNYADTGSPIMFATAALILDIAGDSTSTGAPEVFIEIANA